MRKVLSILISVVMLLNTTFGVTLTQIADGDQIQVTIGGGEEIKVNALKILGKTFGSWTVTGATITNNSSEEISFTMPNNNVTIEANYIDELAKYTVTYDANGGENAPNSQTKQQNEELTLRTITPIRDGHKFLGWSTNSTATEAEYQAGESFTQDANTTLYAVWEKEVAWNKPVLGTGLNPVNWNGSAWVDTTEASWDYNYETASSWNNTVAGDGTAMWANARTEDGSMYVWIPRFTYYVNNGNSVSWNADTAGTARTYILFSNGTEDYTTDPTGNTSYTYSVHGAFRPGPNELTGFWIGKYEASRNDATSSSEGNGTTPTSKPGVIGWRNISVNNAFSYSKNVNTTLGSHMLKDDEWGAVAYLTSAVGRIPYVNNSSTYITGNAGDTQDASSTSGVTNAWNSVKGVRASTTHNIYGVYDMSGGASEYVSAYYSGYSSSISSNISNLISSNTSDGNKYVNLYTITGPTGDNAKTEWDSDYIVSLDSSYPVPRRGGACDSKSMAGVFAFGDGYLAHTSGLTVFGFRIALWGKSI